MTLVFDEAAHGVAIATSAGCLFRKGDRVISRVEDGVLFGGVIYTDGTDNSISLHLAGFRPNWISRDLMWVSFDYPFVQLNLPVIFGRVRSDNVKALAFDLKLGFKEVARIGEVYKGADLVVLALRRSECRWLQLNCPARRTMTVARGLAGVEERNRSRAA